MIEELNLIIPKSNCKHTSSENIFIVDYKHINNGIVELHEESPEVNFVHLSNENNVEVYFNGFLENALEIEKGNCSSQCECVLFSNPYSNTTWTLFIETKYVNSLENAFRESNEYPYSMVNQIIKTVEFFREKNLIGEETVNAIVSFPTLIEDFSASFFTGDMSIEDILLNHKIRIRAINSAKILSNKRIKLEQL
ncbi:hypothetical protein SL053_002561 [Flavobacterium psychrophilum]|jgi:hypothetical protein|nr:hypothetical protein [Flavobacterium psychrophilum]